MDRKLPQTSAFGGTVRTYFLETNGDHDFLQFMVDRKQIIDENIEAVQFEPKKVQLSARLKLEKPVLADEDATDLTIHVNSKMETVYLGERLTERFFHDVGSNVIESVQFYFSRKWVEAQRDQWSFR